MVPNLELHALPVERSVDSKKINESFLMLLCFGYCANNRTFSFAYWTCSGMFLSGSWQGTADSERLELTVANVGTTGYLENSGSQPGNQRLLQGIAVSEKQEFMFSKLSGNRCQELRVPKA